MSVQQNNTYLMQTLNFTPQELSMNQSGAISEEQKARLQARMMQYKQSGTKIIVVVLLMTTIAGVAFFYLNPETGASLQELISTTPVIGVVLGATLLIWLIMLIVTLARSGKVDFTNAKLAMVSGKAKRKKIDMYYGAAAVALEAAGENKLNCTVKIGKVLFYMTETMYDGFADGLNYRVYYVPYGRFPLIVSAEALEV
jgi:hypothetical protein